MSQSGDVLHRFLDALLQQITVTRPEYLTGPFTVAEIYQDLVPYRSHRDLIGVEMNGDYEDALARMFAGEGDYLLLDSDVARRELQEELSGPNPNMALFREFAALDVRLHPSRVPLGAETGSELGAETAEMDTIGPELAGTRAEDLYAELETELERDGLGEMPQPPSDERAVGPKTELGGSSDDGVVGHIGRLRLRLWYRFRSQHPRAPIRRTATPAT